MLKFKPYRIVVNGSNEDDEAYEWWKSSGSDPAKRPKNMDDMELRRHPFFSPRHALYEAMVYLRLLKISRYRAGQLVLAASQQLSADIYINPPGMRDAVIGMDNESGIRLAICPASAASARPSNQYLKNSRVRFMPYLTESCDQSDSKYADDSTLLHELVHGVRPRQFEKLKPQTTNDHWTDLEEFFAVMIENIYMSERGDREVRGGHQAGANTLPATRTASYQFMEDQTNYQRVKDALKREKLAQELAKLDDIPFNPFAEFNRAKRDLRSI
ncbi:MAG: hypothetical protein JNM60_05435 [Candidatus Competibacteraceae bacterium]|nr:hypothetical protein [Candidatus Competibacteraceae bacterium]